MISILHFRTEARARRVIGWATALGLAAAALISTPAPSVADGEWVRFADHSDIRALYETGDTLWVGTGGGLVLVNAGSGDVVSTIDASAGLPSNSVRALFGLGGTVYAGTDGGLAACRRGRDGSISCERVGEFADIRHVSVGPSGTIYVGTFGRGVAEVRDGRAVWVTKADSLLDDKVYAVREGVGGAVFYATSMGLCARTGAAWVSYQAGAGLPRGEVREIESASGRWRPGADTEDSYVLVGGRGVYLFDGRRARALSAPGLFREDDVAAIDVAEDGTLWAAGRYGGLGRYRGGTWEPVGEKAAAIANVRWRCAHAGRTGVVYFGSADGILAAANGREVRHVSVPSGFPGGSVGSMVLDPGGRLYVAAGEYVLSRGGDGSEFAVEGDFGSVLAIALSPDGDVWVIGRWGLYERQAGRWVEIRPDIHPRPPLLTSLAFDSTGSVWAGAESGEIFRFDGDLWVRCAQRGELSGGAVERIVVDRRGTVWVLSDSGVDAFDGRAWAEAAIEGLDSTGVVDLTADTSGEPVLLTRSQVWRFSPSDGWRRIPAGDPDIAGGHRAIGFGRNGRLYLATEKGVGLVGEGGLRWIGLREGAWGPDATSILVEGDRYLWVGFQRDGICRILLENP